MAGIFNPESGLRGPAATIWDAATVLGRIRTATGWEVSVPNPFPGEHGAITPKGIVSARVSQALYQAWRLRALSESLSSPRVLEIGAGLGRTAYYARELGITDYTIVDIPTSLLAQGYFLGRTLGEQGVWLHGEGRDAMQARIKLVPPTSFLDDNSTYDIIVNVDSMTELSRPVVDRYPNETKRRCRIFLSVNHESNQFYMLEVLRASFPDHRISRFPYWLRQGYVEEVVFISPDPGPRRPAGSAGTT